MKIFRWLSLVLIVVLISSCNKPLPALDGINREEWVADRHGCNGVRVRMHDAVQQEKEKLLALDQLQIVKLLGNPDQNELYKRNQKFFYYFIDPAPTCPDGDSSARRLVIRFNAVGLAKEVSVERESGVGL